MPTTSDDIIPTWFLPTFYGDIQLETETEGFSAVITTKLTPKEKDAIAKLAGAPARCTSARICSPATSPSPVVA